MPRRRLLIYLLVVIALASTYIASQDWHVIAARFWHWRHGYSTTLGEYVIPVRPGWSVSLQGRDSVLLVDVENRSGIITVMTHRNKTKDLKFWNGMERSFLLKRGVQNIDDREFRIGDETLSCVGGPASRALQEAFGSVMSYDCMSDGRLDVLLIGPTRSVESALALASEIRTQASAETGTKQQ
jgi:hypothetical protein